MLGGYYFYLSKEEKKLKEKLIELFNLLQRYNFCVNAKKCLQISLDKERISQEEFDERIGLFNTECTDQKVDLLKEEIISFFDKHTNLRLLIKYNDSSDLYLLTSNKSKIKYLFTSNEWKEIEKNFNKSNFECISNKEPEEIRKAKRQAKIKEREIQERIYEKKSLLENKGNYNKYLSLEEQFNQKEEEYNKISQKYKNLLNENKVINVKRKYNMEDEIERSNMNINKDKIKNLEIEIKRIEEEYNKKKSEFLAFRNSIPFNKTSLSSIKSIKPFTKNKLSSMGGRKRTKKRKTIRRRRR
jgi:hypothetical protein